MDEERLVGQESGPAAPSRIGRRAARFVGGVVVLTLLAGTAGAVVATWWQGGLGVLVGRIAWALRPSLPPAVIAERVDPAVVDVDVTLAFGQGIAEGTGMIVTPSGEVLTNNHVVAGAGQIAVVLPVERRTFRARVVGVDPRQDVAVLQLLGARNLPTVPLGRTGALGLGAPVVALGNALGLGGKPRMTVGTVTATNRAITATNMGGESEQLSGLIETDAALEPGDSGGPLLNGAGQVVGMDTAAERTTVGGLSFAIPINRVLSVADWIVHRVSRPSVVTRRQGFLGVAIAPVPRRGALVEGVLPGTPAAGLGLEPGDVIVAFDGRRIDGPDQLVGQVRAFAPGTRVTVTWLGPAGSVHRGTARLTVAPWL
jgi:S1-C subfamily serine protease